MSMALGTGLSIMILATLVHHARERFLAHQPGLTGYYLAQASRIAVMLGGVILILFALVLFNSVIRSAPTAILSPPAANAGKSSFLRDRPHKSRHGLHLKDMCRNGELNV